MSNTVYEDLIRLMKDLKIDKPRAILRKSEFSNRGQVLRLPPNPEFGVDYPTIIIHNKDFDYLVEQFKLFPSQAPASLKFSFEQMIADSYERLFQEELKQNK